MKDSKYYLKLEDKGYYETIDKRSKDYREYKQDQIQLEAALTV